MFFPFWLCLVVVSHFPQDGSFNFIYINFVFYFTLPLRKARQCITRWCCPIDKFFILAPKVSVKTFEGLFMQTLRFFRLMILKLYLSMQKMFDFAPNLQLMFLKMLILILLLLHSWDLEEDITVQFPHEGHS